MNTEEFMTLWLATNGRDRSAGVSPAAGTE